MAERDTNSASGRHRHAIDAVVLLGHGLLCKNCDLDATKGFAAILATCLSVRIIASGQFADLPAPKGIAVRDSLVAMMLTRVLSP